MMTDQPDYILDLLVRHLQETISPEEAATLEEWRTASERNGKLYAQLTDTAFINGRLKALEKYDVEKGWGVVNSQLAMGNEETEMGNGQWLMVNAERGDVNGEWSMVNAETGKEGRSFDSRSGSVRRLWKRMAVAAAFVGVLLVAGYWLQTRTMDDGPQITDPSIALQADVKAPDKNRAMIQLADGTTVYLDSASNGNLASVNGVNVVKTSEGQIVYNGHTSAGSVPMDNGQMDYHTLTNPKGSRVIDMTLSDGSRVWLNAGSSITYPVAFAGNERKVSMDGEGYFEISRQSSVGSRELKPFIVSKGDVTVTVLGTRFNVNAYEDEEEIKVTLLEGAVKVNTKDEVRGTILKPGEQAVSTGNSPSTALRVNKTVDVEQVMAWRKGVFDFGARTSLQEIMRQISRWYDVEVVFEDDVNDYFGGSISRDVNVSKVLTKLELTGRVTFRIEGKKVLVRR
jgi:transmembrane sensor